MNKVKKKILKICILTTISASSINCFAMEKNSEDIFKNSEIYNSQESYYDEDSYNYIKTPINKIKLNNNEEELSLSYKINDEEDLFNKDNKYLNKKTTRKNEDVLKNKKFQNSYNQKEPNLIKTPVMKNRDLIDFQNNNKDFDNISPFNMLSNNLYQYTSQKTKIIDSDSNYNEYVNNVNLNKNSQDSYNQIKLNPIQHLKNELNPNNYIVNNNFEEREKEKDDSSVRANFGENEDKEKFVLEFVLEEYKKRIICAILKQHLKDEIDKVIKEHILNSKIENKNNILKDINCNITLSHNLLKLPYYKFKLRPTDFSILLPDNIKKIFKNKDAEYINLLLYIITNYKVIFKKSIVKTLKELPKLKKEDFNRLLNEKGTKQSCNNLIQKILGNQEFNNTRVYNELINFSKNDCLYQYFTNLKYLINFIYLKVLEQDNTKNSSYKNYKNIFRTDISNDSFYKYYIDNINIPEEKAEIKFKDYNDFFKELNQIQFNS